MNVCVKFHYDRLRIDKALGIFRKSDNNKNNNRKKNKKNVRSALGVGTLFGSNIKTQAQLVMI